MQFLYEAVFRIVIIRSKLSDMALKVKYYKAGNDLSSLVRQFEKINKRVVIRLPI
jgi:hypothetical protein